MPYHLLILVSIRCLKLYEGFLVARLHVTSANGWADGMWSDVSYRRMLCTGSTSGLRPTSLGISVMLENSTALPRHW